MDHISKRLVSSFFAPSFQTRLSQGQGRARHIGSRQGTGEHKNTKHWIPNISLVRKVNLEGSQILAQHSDIAGFGGSFIVKKKNDQV